MSKVCLCRGITEEQIVEAIKNGASSFEEVKEETGAGAGGCRGGRCKCNIELRDGQILLEGVHLLYKLFNCINPSFRCFNITKLNST